MVRPVRVGLALSPTVDNVMRAVAHATSSWGGKYFPMLPSRDKEAGDRLARFFAVDVIVAVDEDENSKELEELPGFRWRGASPYGALDPPRNDVTTRVLDTSTLTKGAAAARLPPQLLFPQWEATDPFHRLYSVLYGRYEDSAYGRELARGFGEMAEEAAIGPQESAPYPEDRLVPIDLTSFGVTSTSSGQDIGFFILDPNDADDLMSFWNMRADGANVFPWPREPGDRLADAASRWLDSALATGRVPRPTKGTGEQGGPAVRVWSLENDEVPPNLLSLLKSRHVEHRPSVGEPLPLQWRGTFPLETKFEESFTAALDEEGFSIEIALPQIDFLPRRPEPFTTGIVTAHVQIYSERGLPHGWVVAVPNVRLLSSLLEGYGDPSHPFHRGTGEGRTVGISPDRERFNLDPISSFSIFERLLAASGWECARTDGGRFTGQLVELLGGQGSHAANQPALRAVLTQAAASPRGRPIPALIETARSRQGSWPGPISRPEQQRAYPERLVNYLLARKLLRPALPVRCPRCATETGWPPDGLATVLTCPMCEEHFPLGLALSLAGRRTDWLYRLPGNIPSPKLAETFPVMAALDVVAGYRHLSPASLPHVFGLRIETPDEQREVDILAALDDRGLPVMVAGEAKSYRDEIDRRDIQTLLRLQDYFHSQHLEAFILVATLREDFEGVTRQALREACERAQGVLYYPQGERLALPITLVARDLSAHPWADDHPSKWARPAHSLADFAMESCRRNLGLEGVEYIRSKGDYAARFIWGS